MNLTAPPIAPFVSSLLRVEPDWIDYNGHLNMAYYHVLFDRAVDEAFLAIGLGPDYRRERQASYFLAESHVLYRREVGLGDPLRVTMQLVDVDKKGVHYVLELRHAAEGWLSACCENVSLHMDMRARKVAPFPPDIAAALARAMAAHAELPRPDYLGRVMGLRAGGVGSA